MMKKRNFIILIVVIAILAVTTALVYQNTKPKVKNKYSTYTSYHSLKGKYTEKDHERARRLINAIKTRNTLLINILLMNDMEVNCTNANAEYMFEDIPKTPLNVALELGYNDIAYKLLRNGATAKHVIDTWSVFNCATSSYEKGDLEMVEFLLENEADPKKCNLAFVAMVELPEDRKQEAAEEVLEIFKKLVTGGADINNELWHGENTLICAASANNFPLVKYLLEEKNMNINYQDNHGGTALIISVHHQNTDMITYLLEHGADKTLVNKDGETALDIAIKSGVQTNIDLLS